MQESDDAFDMILLIMTLAVFTPIMIYCSIPFFKGEVGGFNVQIEKTALETEGEIVPDERFMTSNDVLLMLVVADKFTPVPNHLQLNVTGRSAAVPIDEAFLQNKEGWLQTAKGAMPVKEEVRLELYAGPSGMRYWNVTGAQP